MYASSESNVGCKTILVLRYYCKCLSNNLQHQLQRGFIKTWVTNAWHTINLNTGFLFFSTKQFIYNMKNYYYKNTYLIDSTNTVLCVLYEEWVNMYPLKRLRAVISVTFNQMLILNVNVSRTHDCKWNMSLYFVMLSWKEKL